MAWRGDTPKRTFFAFLLGAAIIYGLFSLIIAVGTQDSACPTPDWPKTWRVFPPAWDCERSFGPW